jgi:hypothetical protein
VCKTEEHRHRLTGVLKNNFGGTFYKKHVDECSGLSSTELKSKRKAVNKSFEFNIETLVQEFSVSWLILTMQSIFLDSIGILISTQMSCLIEFGPVM